MTDIRETIDQLLATPKQFAGTSKVWTSGPRNGQRKWKSALLVGGQVTDMDLIAIGYPNEPDPTFTIHLIYMGSAIVRLEYGPFEEHNNGWVVPDGITRWKIRGSHIHSWADNREFSTKTKLPKELEFARLLPSKTRGFDSVFRWFCDEHQIACISPPDYPLREHLL